jgi:hypothetical protein
MFELADKGHVQALNTIRWWFVIKQSLQSKPNTSISYSLAEQTLLVLFRKRTKQAY